MRFPKGGLATRVGVVAVIVLLWGSALDAFDGYGVCFYPYQSNETNEEVFRLLEAAGVRWIRFGYRWNEIGYLKGIFNFKKNDHITQLAQKHGIKILGVIGGRPKWGADPKNPAILNLNEWKMFVKMLIVRYKGSVNHWEVWNEPDLKKFWKGTPEEYVELLKSAYETIKGIDPDIKVISAGLNGKAKEYLPRLLSLGFQQYCDIIAYHPYAPVPEEALKKVVKFSNVLKRHGVNKPLWITEIGWQTGGRKGPGIVKDEAVKALYLKQAFQLLKPYAGVIFWFRGVEGAKRYGLIEENEGELKIMPAYTAFKGLTKGGVNQGEER